MKAFLLRLKQAAIKVEVYDRPTHNLVVQCDEHNRRILKGIAGHNVTPVKRDFLGSATLDVVLEICYFELREEMPRMGVQQVY